MTELALSAHYRTPQPDAAVDLYEGQILVEWDGVSMEGPGKIRFEWQPFPYVGFEVVLDVAPDTPDTPDEISITLQAVGGTSKARPWQVKEGVTNGALLPRTIHGAVMDELLVGNPAATDHVLFHVPNFPDYIGEDLQSTPNGGTLWKGRMTATTPEWIVDLDIIPHQADLMEAAAKQRCNVITHVGRIRRLDGNAVDFNDAERLCELAHWWLSLLRGERTGPFLIMGIHDDQTVWQIWRSVTVSPWRGRWSWLPNLVTEGGVVVPTTGGDVFSGLAELWADAETRRAIVRAIDWYTQSVSNNHLATRVILAQAGLELMSWLRIVRQVGLSEDSFGKLPAADALRVALSFATIPTAVPVQLTELHGAAQPAGGGQQLDGPGAITEIRNGVVHPKTQERFNDSAMHDGGQLAVHFLELLILHQIGYNGFADDRTDAGNPKRVPWAP